MQHLQFGLHNREERMDIRSAAKAVYGLLELDREPPAVYKGQYDSRVLFGAFQTLHEMTV